MIDHPTTPLLLLPLLLLDHHHCCHDNRLDWGYWQPQIGQTQPDCGSVVFAVVHVSGMFRRRGLDWYRDSRIVLTDLNDKDRGTECRLLLWP